MSKIEGVDERELIRQAKKGDKEAIRILLVFARKMHNVEDVSWIGTCLYEFLSKQRKERGLREIFKEIGTDAKELQFLFPSIFVRKAG